MIRSRLIVFLVLLGLSVPLTAQECSVKLRDAENLFNAGLVEEVPALLENCLADGFTKTEEHSAYQIIIRSYLLKDKIDMAETTMLEFLKKNPEYKLRPTDNADFVYLFNKYKVEPLIQISANAGTNLTFMTTIDDENSLSGVPQGKNYANESMAFTAGLEVKFKFGEHFEIGTGFEYNQVTFGYNEPFLNFSESIYPEIETRLAIPVQGYYYPKSFGRFSPFIKLGGAASFNISTVANPRSNNIDANNVIPRTGEPENRTASRRFVEPIFIAGLGFRYKLPMSYFFVDISSHIGTLNQYSSGELTNSEWFYFCTDDSFRVNNLRFTIGYTYIIYKPSKKEE